MKKSDLKTIIREEIQRVLTEDNADYSTDPTMQSTIAIISKFLQAVYDANGDDGIEKAKNDISNAIKNIKPQ
jgi:hypothetical protein